VRVDFRIAPATAAAIRKHAPKIVSISGERILDELSKMLACGSAAKAMRTLEAMGLAQEVLRELFEEQSAWEAGLKRLEGVALARDANLAMGALLADLPPAVIGRMVRRWGGSNALRQELESYAEHLGDWSIAAEMPLCDLKRLMAQKHFEKLRRLWRVEERRQTGSDRQGRRIARRVKRIPAGKVCPPPLVSGGDLMSLGIDEGPELGRILRAVHDAQLNEDIRCRREAMDMARRMRDQRV